MPIRGSSATQAHWSLCVCLADHCEHRIKRAICAKNRHHARGAPRGPWTMRLNTKYHPRSLPTKNLMSLSRITSVQNPSLICITKHPMLRQFCDSVCAWSVLMSRSFTVGNMIHLFLGPQSVIQLSITSKHEAPLGLAAFQCDHCEEVFLHGPLDFVPNEVVIFDRLVVLPQHRVLHARGRADGRPSDCFELNLGQLVCDEWALWRAAQSHRSSRQGRG